MSNNKWIELIIKTPNTHDELLYSILYDYNITTFEIIDYRTYLDLVKDKPYWIELKHDLLEKSNDIIVKIYLLESEFNELQLKKLIKEIKNIDEKIKIDYNSNIEDIDWSLEWKKHYKPLKIGNNIIIKPSWEKYNNINDNIVIEIDPQMAFGTGTHETTSLCIEALQKIDLKDKVICDIGSGSGILSITAAKLGAKKVNSIDIDPISVKTTIENAKINNVDKIIYAQEGDLLNKKIEKSDIVVANILHNVILNLIPDLNSILHEGSYFIASGIIEEKSNLIKNKLIDFNFEIIKEYNKGEWVCILAKYKNA